MFYIKYILKKSKLHGIGLFANENISKGQKIYKENPDLNLFLSSEKFLKLPLDERKTIQHYGYFDKKINKWHLSFDDIRFCNHSLKGNITFNKGILVALKDIKKGEELIQNYEEFESLRDELKK